MEVKLAVLADYASVSQQGKLNIMGVFTDINPPKLPFAMPTMFVVTQFQAQPVEVGQQKAVRVVLGDSEAKEMLAMEQSLTVPAPQRPGFPIQINTMICLNMVVFQKADSYRFDIMINGEPKAQVDLRVNEPPKSQEAE